MWGNDLPYSFMQYTLKSIHDIGLYLLGFNYVCALAFLILCIVGYHFTPLRIRLGLLGIVITNATLCAWFKFTLMQHEVAGGLIGLTFYTYLIQSFDPLIGMMLLYSVFIISLLLCIPQRVIEVTDEEKKPAPKIKESTPIKKEIIATPSRAEPTKIVEQNVEIISEPEEIIEFTPPPPTLFVQASKKELNSEETSQKAKALVEKLKQFGVIGSITHEYKGPVVTTYEFQPDNTIKVSRVLNLEDDLMMALQAHSVRIIAPIPGKSVIGFEVANSQRNTVHFGDLVNSKIWKNNKAALPLAVGCDTRGQTVIIDLTEQPHMLVAGSTGSGKSVALNTMLTSMILTKTPEELQLILIDPKRLEFSAYQQLSHLIFPIITTTERALSALSWAVSHMDERYEKMASLNVKDWHSMQKQYPGQMPLLVIIIDELADLMITGGKEVELLITRLAQMSRAAGIHLIIATQRPSVDVITGLLKVNFPSRIACKVMSRIDSRTILDMQGAEKLLGKGDMLYLNPQGSLQRLHGAYISMREIMEAVEHCAQQQQPYFRELTSTISTNHHEQNDPLLNQILEFLGQVDEISISLLQRKFRIGYNRSARIIETLESRGNIAPSYGSKMRKVIKNT
jgi:S-DNA-T family DNA segregation ATPase FtsK/SpoIIIE